MGKIKIWFFCAALSFSFLAPVFSETIILKSGQRVEGKITEETDKYVKIDFEGVELTFYNDEIFSIDRSSSGGADAVSPQMEMLYNAYIAAKNNSGVSEKKGGNDDKTGLSEEQMTKEEVEKKSSVRSRDISLLMKNRKLRFSKPLPED